MTGREPWERYNGDDIEAVIAIMLLLENPRGQRIRPSRGDGGVDVMIPHSPTRWEVYQVKGFATSLNTNHKRQIKKSWESLLRFTQKRKVEVTRWHVARPIDPTHPDRDWLAKLTEDSNIPTDWIGLTHIEGWSAKYPEVLDYYLRDGKETVNQQAMRFLQAAGMDSQVQSGSLVEPDRALEGILAWAQALNKSDPHFRYNLSTMAAPSSGELTMSSEDPRQIYSKLLVHDGHAARLDVYERFNGAAEYRSDLAETLQLNFRPRSEDEHAALQDFFTYGIPFEGIPVDLASQQGSSIFTPTESTSAEISIASDMENHPQLYEFSAYKSDGTRGPALEMEMFPFTTGFVGSQNKSWRGNASSGLASITIKIREDSCNFSLTIDDNKFFGIRPRKVLDTLSSLEQMQAGCALDFRIPDGPTFLRTAEISEDLITQQELKPWINICDCLLTLQKHIPHALVIPQAEEMTTQKIKDWFMAASLLRRETVWRNWDALGMTLADESHLQLPVLVRVTRPLKVCIGGTEWTVGFVNQEVIAGRWLAADGQDGASGSLLPTESSRLRLTLADDEQAQHRAEAGRVQYKPLDQAGPVLDNPEWTS